MMMKIPKITQSKKVVMGSILTGVMLISQNVVADDCRLSVVLDRTGSMGNGAVPTSKCAIGLDFAIGVVQGFINGDDVSIIPAGGGAANPINPQINANFYDNKCLLSDRKVEIITVSDASGFPSAPDNFTGGFVDPAVALSQLQTLQLTDGAGTSSCTGNTAIADALCISASNLRAEIPDFSDYRKMEIITDGGENASSQAPATVCDSNLPSEWIVTTGSELLFGGAAIVIDSSLLTDTFFSSSSTSDSAPNNGDEVSGSGKLSVDEQNFFASLSLNTGGSVDLITSVDDVAGTFISPNGGGIDLCDGDLDKDFDVDNLDALRFTKDFNNPACQIK